VAIGSLDATSSFQAIDEFQACGIDRLCSGPR